MKVVFIKYHLGFAHSVGDTADLPDEAAKALIESSYATTQTSEEGGKKGKTTKE